MPFNRLNNSRRCGANHKYVSTGKVYDFTR